MSAETDQVLGGRYRLTERIAGGGMGEVWKGADEVLGREVAVKILRREYADDPRFLARFRAEAKHTASLSHVGIAAVFDFGESASAGAAVGGSPYLVMEHVPGQPLSAIVANEGALAPERAMDIVGQAALALQAAHEGGVIHRDVKPGNILVTPDGTVKITDFGIARATNSVPLTQTGAIMGTAYYISPEQASGRPVSPASDVYSLGIVAYECLTGRRPFPGDTPVSVALAQVNQQPPALGADVPEAVRDLVMRMLAKEPGDRPTSAGDVGREALALRPQLAAAAATGATRVLPALGGDPAGPPTDPPYGGETTVVTAREPVTDPGFRLPDPSRLPSWTPYAVALVVLALALLLVARACGADATDTPGAGTSGTATETRAANTATSGNTGNKVQVARADLLGRPAEEVATELRDLGLRVRQESSAGGGAVGSVQDVRPTGSLDAGTLVTLEVVSEPAPKPHKPKGGKHNGGKGKGRKH